jgi:prepilin-type N-terminal cleavage/methylation domain-containing protein
MASTIRHPPHASPGFSLPEVLTAISLFGVIGAVAVSNFVSYMPGYRVRGAALQIAGDMNQARLAAIKEVKQYYYVPQGGTTYRINYDNGAGGQTVLKTVDVAANYPQVRFGTTGIGSDPYGAAGTPAAVPAATIIFNSDGTVVNPAGVYVEPTVIGTTHVQQGVTVTAGGRIRVWHYDGSAWK